MVKFYCHGEGPLLFIIVITDQELILTDWHVSYQIWILGLGCLNRLVGVYSMSLRVMELGAIRREILRLRSG